MSSKTDKVVREDFLDEDPEIPSQKYVLLSFISPENVLKNKDQFFFKNFLKSYEVQWKTKKFEEFLAGQIMRLNTAIDAVSEKVNSAGNADLATELSESRIKVDEFIGHFQKYVKQNTSEIQDTQIEEEYKNFLFNYEKKLEEEFHSANQFRTTVRGLKIRGSYSTIEEAKAKAKKLQKVDDVHNIALGEVGKWLPWDPSSDQFSSQEYAEDQLNQLMQKYKENEDNKNEMFKAARLKNGGVTIDGEEVSGATVKDTFEPMFGGDDLALAKKDAAASSDATASDADATAAATDATAATATKDKTE
jgi:hypothetical protein